MMYTFKNLIKQKYNLIWEILIHYKKIQKESMKIYYKMIINYSKKNKYIILNNFENNFK